MTPRIVLAVAGLAALALPMPAATILGIGLTAAGVAALGAAVVRPGSSGPAVVIVVAVLSWLAGADGYQRAARLVALALAIAVVHSAAALAAVLPARSRVPAVMLLRWAGWTVVATAVGVAVVRGTALVPAPPPLVITVLAVLLVGAAGGLAVWFGAGRRRAGPAPENDEG